MYVWLGGCSRTSCVCGTVRSSFEIIEYLYVRQLFVCGCVRVCERVSHTFTIITCSRLSVQFCQAAPHKASVSLLRTRRQRVKTISSLITGGWMGVRFALVITQSDTAATLMRDHTVDGLRVHGWNEFCIHRYTATTKMSHTHTLTLTYRHTNPQTVWSTC